MSRQKLIHLHSAVDKIPLSEELNYGEIAVQYAKENPVLYIKDTDGEIVKFISEKAVKEIYSNGVVEFGKYSNISGDTAMVIGNGTSESNRSNLFEIKTNGDIYVNGVKKL